MVVPGVVHKSDAMIDRAPDDTNALLLITGPPNVVPAKADQRHLFTCTSERSVEHVAFAD